MEQMNFHKQKLYALIAAGVGLISCFLPWWSFSFGPFGSYSVNGMHEIGILSFLGFIGAGVLCFLGDKTKPFDGQFKMIAAGCFAGAGLIALIQFLRQTSFASFGIWLAILCGIAGAVVVYVLKPKQLNNKPPTTPNSPNV
jgi:hypothetical protein